MKKWCIVARRTNNEFKINDDLTNIFINLNVEYKITSNKNDALKDSEYYDALLVPGGHDLNPKLYNEEINGSENIEDDIDELDFEYLKAFDSKHKLILGICRGIQCINVYFGGSLIQDIKNHRLENNTTHNIKVNKDEFIYDIYSQDNVLVNSRHHQCIKKIAPHFNVCAISDDDIIEGIHRDNVYAVQWHPETMNDLIFFSYFN